MQPLHSIKKCVKTPKCQLRNVSVPLLQCKFGIRLEDNLGKKVDQFTPLFSMTRLGFMEGQDFIFPHLNLSLHYNLFILLLLFDWNANDWDNRLNIINLEMYWYRDYKWNIPSSQPKLIDS